MMERERWEQIERLYYAALEREPDARNGFLEGACAGDDQLRREVAGLLAYDLQSDTFIQSPAVEIGAKALAAELLTEASTKLIGSPIVRSQSRRAAFSNQRDGGDGAERATDGSGQLDGGGEGVRAANSRSVSIITSLSFGSEHRTQAITGKERLLYRRDTPIL